MLWAGKGNRQLLTYQIRRALEWIRIKVRVACCRLWLRVTEELTDDRQPQARACTNRCEGVPQVVQPHPFKLGVSTNGVPRLLKICARLTLLLTGDDERVRAAVRSKLIDDIERRLIQYERFAPGL
jgi:hypothetical protein